MDTPLVTVVIPAYNAAPWIGDTIRSVLKQSYRNIEIIVIDDHSNDSTVELVQNFPVKLFVNPTNLGECKSSRWGFLQAHGRYICRLSADDAYMDRHYIGDQVEVMERSGTDWCYHSVNMVGDYIFHAKPVETCWIPIPMRWFKSGLKRLDNLILSFPRLAFVLIMLRNPVNASSIMFRRDSYMNVQWSEIDQTDCDSVLLMNMLLNGQHGIAIHSPGVFYRTHPGQGSIKPEYLKVRDDHRNQMRQKVLKGKYPIWLKLLVRLTGV